jgi:hypothetical protein
VIQRRMKALPRMLTDDENLEQIYQWLYKGSLKTEAIPSGFTETKKNKNKKIILQSEGDRQKYKRYIEA